MDALTAHQRQEEVQLLDVRTDPEWHAGHIEGSLHIPMDALGARLAEVDRERAVVVVCRSGSRSAVVAQALASVGFDTHNLDGGLVRWVGHRLPLTTADGRPGEVA